LIGRATLAKCHVSIPALQITAGLVFFLVAIRHVLEPYEPAHAPAPEPLPPTPFAAALRLVFPMVLTPYGIAAVIALLAASGSVSDVARAEASVTLIREGWGQDNPAARQMFTSLIVPEAAHEEMRWFNELERISASAETAIRLLHVLGDIDVTELLPRVAVPTLVVHSRADARVPLEQGLMLARGIRNARLVVLESKNHLILAHEPAWQRFIQEISEYLTSEEEPQRVTATV
jgi:pimeloyl-ACP methyl ester carboxylesterase